MLSETAEDWLQSLLNFTPDQIARAINAFTETPREWQPNKGQFLDVCKQFSRPEHVQRLALPKPRNKEVAMGALAEIRKTLRSR